MFVRLSGAIHNGNAALAAGLTTEMDALSGLPTALERHRHWLPLPGKEATGCEALASAVE